MYFLEVQENAGSKGRIGILLQPNCLMIIIIVMYDTDNNWPGYVVHRPPLNISLSLPGKGKKVINPAVFMCIVLHNNNASLLTIILTMLIGRSSADMSGIL